MALKAESWLYRDPLEIVLSTIVDVIERTATDPRDSEGRHYAVTQLMRWAMRAYDELSVEVVDFCDLHKVQFTPWFGYRTLHFFFTGQRSRVCVSDEPYVLASSETCSSQFLAVSDVYLVPWLFCLFTALCSAVACGAILYYGRPRNRKMVMCTIGVTERFMQNLHNFTSLKTTDDKRDISSPLANTLDATKGVPSEIQTMLFYVLGGMAVRVDRYYGWWGRETDAYRMMRQHNCNMKSTQFSRVASTASAGGASASPGAAPGFARLKTIWDRLARYGHHGYQVYLSGRRTVLTKLVGEGKLPLDQTAESTMVMAGAEAMPDAVPPEGVQAGFVPNPNVTAPGPVMEPATCHDPAGVSHSVESRTLPTLLANGRPRRFNPTSGAGKRFLTWANALCAEITDARMDKQFDKLYGEVQLGEGPVGPYSAEDMKRFVSEAQLMNDASDMPTRMSGGKRELIPKDGKDVRSVVDNTPQVFAMMNCAGKVLEAVMFDPVDGIFRDTCIKHRTRPEIAAELQQCLREPNCYGWEIDQTRMEAHARIPGTLKVIIKMLEKVMRHVRGRYSAQLSHVYDTRIKFDQKNGMRISIRVNNVCFPDGSKKVVLCFKDFYLDSGWLLTSLGNFILETGATLACSVENPEHMFCKDKDGNMRMMEGTFNHLYRGIAVKGRRPAKPVYMKGREEGDDGAGQISKHAGNPQDLADTIRENMSDLGFDAKYKVICDGRLEFVGLHATVVDGAVSADVPIIPAVKRSLGKLGFNVQPDGRSPAQVAATDAMRFFSLAEMFCGKVPAMCKIFEACARKNMRKAGEEESKLMRDWGEYSEVGRAWGAGQHSLSGVAENFTLDSFRNDEAPSAEVQLAALATSLELPSLDAAALAKLEILAMDCDSDEIDHLSCYLQLPSELRGDGGAI